MLTDVNQLETWARALRAAMSHEDVSEVSAQAPHINVLVWEEATAPRVRIAARRIGIPEHVLRIVRLLPFLVPYPNDDERSTHAHVEFLANNVPMVSEDSAVLLTSMPAIAGPQPTRLILGSMPGEVSLRAGEYYAHPQNRFWRMIEDVFGIPRTEPYAQRVAALSARGVALWDVLKQCSRVGSLDSRIIRSSEVPNDLTHFLQRHDIRRVVFNGRKAAQAFRRLVEPDLPPSLSHGLRKVEAPSTSPANTRIAYPALVEAWRDALW